MKTLLFFLLLTTPALAQDSLQAAPHWPPPTAHYDSLLQLTQVQHRTIAYQKGEISNFVAGSERRQEQTARIAFVIVLTGIGYVIRALVAGN